MSRLDLRQIRAFAAVARHGGFSAAAREVGLTQPTLSTHISKLEKAVGASLFDRTGRAASLTPAGELFAGYADRILDLCDQSMEAVSGFAGRITGRVPIAASTVPGEYILPRHLAAFAGLYPDVTVTLTVSDSAAVVTSVLQGEAAVGVVGTKPAEPGLRARLWCRDRIALVAPTGTVDAGRLEPGQLEDVPLIRREAGSGTRKVVDAALRRVGVDPEALVWGATLGSTRAVIEAATAGLGAAFVSRLAAGRELADGVLREVTVEKLVLDRAFFIITAAGTTLSPAAAKLVESLMDAAEGVTG